MSDNKIETENECQWWVNGECHEPAVRIIERRKEKPSDPDYNIGQINVCWKHLDEASRSHPYDVGPVDNSQNSESLTSSTESARSLEDN